MFFWWFKFDFLNFKHECFVKNDKTNLNQRFKEKKIICESKLSRKFVCFENQTTQTNEFIIFRFCLYSQRIHCWFCFDAFFEWSKRYESIMFHYYLNFIMTKCFVYLMFAYFKRTWRNWFRYNVKYYAKIWYYYIIMSCQDRQAR